jgi:hypothetical protein
MMADSASASPVEDHLLGLAARLLAADAAVAEAIDPRPARWLGRAGWRLRRLTTARAAARIRPDVAELTTTAWTILAELTAAEDHLCAAQEAARRISAPSRPERTTAADARCTAATIVIAGVAA